MEIMDAMAKNAEISKVYLGTINPQVHIANCHLSTTLARRCTRSWCTGTFDNIVCIEI